jgi:hypothetical protein
MVLFIITIEKKHFTVLAKHLTLMKGSKKPNFIAICNALGQSNILIVALFLN